MGLDTDRPISRMGCSVYSTSFSNSLAKGRILSKVVNSSGRLRLLVIWLKSWNLTFKVSVFPLNPERFQPADKFGRYVIKLDDNRGFAGDIFF